MLADANGLQGDDALVAGSSLTVPEVKTSSNDASTFKPYNPSEITGPTAPSLPYIPPPDQGCGAIGMLIMAVVTIVVTVYTAGLATPGVTGSFLGAGLATLTGAGGLALGVTAGAIGGLVGSVAGQAVGSAMGVASFSWRNAAAAGVTSAITAGLGATGALAKVAGALGKFGGSAFGQGAISAVSSNLVNQATQRLAGVDTSFSWKSIAISAVSSGLANAVVSPISSKLGFALATESGQAARDFTAGFAGGIVSAHLHKQFGSGDKVNMGAILADAFGSMLANRLTGQYRVAADAYASRTATMARSATGAETLPAERTFSPSAEQLADWNRLTALEGRRRSEQPLPDVVLGGSHSVDLRASTTTTYRRSMVDSHEIERYGGDPNYLNIVTTYAAADVQRSHVQSLPAYLPAPPRASDTALRARRLEESRKRDAAYYDTYRGPILGNMFAQAGTMANGAGHNLAGFGNSLLGLATDRRYGDEVKSSLAYAVQNPGAVFDAGMENANVWWNSSWDEKLTSAGTAGFEFLSTAGFGALRRLDGLDEIAPSAKRDVGKPNFSGDWNNYKTHGVPDNPLASPEGIRLVAELEQVGFSKREAVLDARRLMGTGSTLPYPNPIEVGDVFYKLVPTGGGVGPKSPFWFTEGQIAHLRNLPPDQIANHLGLPLASQQGSGFSLVSIRATAPGTSFTSRIAPTTEIGEGGVVWQQHGGAEQTLLINRALFTAPRTVSSSFP